MTMKGKLGLAVIGLGRIGKTHLDAIRLNSDVAQLVAVVDLNESLVKSIAEKFNTRFYLSVEEALNDPDIQAAVICLPNHLHTPVSLQIMETGRHVLVEKPWAINMEGGKKMLDKAGEKGVILMAGQSFRFLWALQEAKQRVTKDEIGDPFNIIYIFDTPFDQSGAPAWWRDLNKTGGLLFPGAGSHTVDYTLWIYEGKKPVRVYSEARSLNPDFDGMDEIVITIRFDDDSMATSHLSINTKVTKHECFIAGPKGTLDVIIKGGYTPGKLQSVFSADLFFDGKLVRSDNPEFHQFAVQMREFLEAISQKREPIVKHSEILTQLAILEAAQKSAATHQPVFLNI